MGFLKDDIGDEELNNLICSMLSSNVCIDELLLDNEGIGVGSTPKEIPFIPYKKLITTIKNI